MSITIKTRYIFLAVLLGISTLLFIGYRYGHKRGENVLQASVDAQTNAIHRYEIELNRIKTYVTEKEQEIMTLRQAKDAELIRNEELRKLNIKYVNELTRLKIAIDTLMSNVSHNGQVVIVHDTIKINNDKEAILLPFTFAKRDQWIDFTGTFDKKGTLGINLKITALLDVWAVQKKRKDNPVVMVTTDNPYLNIIGVRSVKLDTPKDRKWGLGIIGGYGINCVGTVKATPFIGGGLSYDFVRF